MIRKRTATDRLRALVAKLNAPKRRKRRVEWATAQQIREEFRAAARMGR